MSKMIKEKIRKKIISEHSELFSKDKIEEKELKEIVKHIR